MKATKLSYYSDQLIFSRLVPTIVLLHFLTIVLSQTNKAGFHINSFSDSGSEYNAASISNEWNVRKLREKNYSDLQASPLPEPIHHPCDELLNETSEAFGDFYKCSIHHARPYRFCEKCSQVYIKAISVYKNIQFTGQNKTTFNCKKYLLESDNSPVIQSAIANIHTIWKNAYCDNCFGKSLVSATANGTELSNSTLKFLLLYQNLTDCISDNILYNLPFNICKNCHHMYTALNRHFNDIEKISSSSVCMDIMDRMNYTRIQWSKTFHCSTKRPSDIALISSIVIGSVAVPIIYYISAYVTSKGVAVIRGKLIRHYNTRSRLTQSQSSYGSVDEIRGINSPTVSSSS